MKRLLLFAAVCFLTTSCINLNRSVVIDRGGKTYSIDPLWIHPLGPLGYEKPIKKNSPEGLQLMKGFWPHTANK